MKLFFTKIFFDARESDSPRLIQVRLIFCFQSSWDRNSRGGEGGKAEKRAIFSVQRSFAVGQNWAKKGAGRMGESQQQHEPLLRSINNVYVSLVRFINKTMRNVVLYWIDYQGRAVSYGVLSPDDCLDIDTFVTHPWIFVDQETKER